MNFIYPMRKIILFFSILLTNVLVAQDEPMQVIRCDAVSRQAPIFNIHVDEDNVKWVANRDGLYKVYDLSYAEPVNISSLDQSLLSIPGGNANIKWSLDELNPILNNELSETNVLTSAVYNAEKDELWLGTTESGAFKLKTEPSLSLIEQINDKTSKMRSNHVNKIYLDTLGREWIATQEGVLVSKRGKWELLEKYFDILSVAVGPSGDWLLTTDYFGNLDKKNVWYPIELPARSTEGRLTDIVFDKDGRLWVSSDVITSYNPETEKVNVYGPAQYFTSEFATSMAADKDGGIWIATEDKGLFLIEKGSNLTVTALVDKELGCDPSVKDAVLTARVIGGVPPYKYAWSDGSESKDLNNIGPGVYNLTVTDGRGRKKIAQVEINDPSIKATTTINKTESDQGAKDGVATVEASGGTSKYNYRWDNGETKAQAVALEEGKHQVTITDSNGCSTVAELNMSRAVLPLTVSIEQTTELDCPGSNSAGLLAKFNGGKGPFQYVWSNGGDQGQINSLSEGVYSVTVNDAVGNSATAEFKIDPKEAMQLDFKIIAPASTGKSDGQASVQVVNGGNGNYTYQWDTDESISQAAQLAPGVHTVTVTDQKGCTVVGSIEITEDIIPLSASIQPTAVISCFDEATAGLSVSTNGGKGPFQYQWSNNATTDKLSNLKAGEYSVTITDAVGGQTTASYSIQQPEAVSASIQVIQPASTGKSDGQAQVEPSGGSGGYSYNWDNDELDQIAKRLAPGKHSVTISDRNNCQTVQEVEITENILPLTASIQQLSEINCTGEASASIKAIVNGGKGPFQFQWSNNATVAIINDLTAGNYTLNITDAEGTTTTSSFTVEEPKQLSAEASVIAPATTDNSDGQAELNVQGGVSPYNITWDNSEVGTKANKLSPGLHTIQVKDANGCTTSAEVEITENILPLSASIIQTSEINCFGGATAGLRVNPKGGKKPFSFQWSKDNSQESNLAGLEAGNYSVTITDSKGSVTQAQYTINQPTEITATATVLEPATTDNEDGKAKVEVNGGTGSFSIAWDNGANTEEVNNLAPGQHTVTLTDQNNCSTTAQVEITENILPLTASLEQIASINCYGETTAALKVSYQGGKGPFQVSWSEASLDGETVSDLGAGDYQVSVTDAVGNTTSATFRIVQPRQLSYSIQKVESASTDNEDGKASFNVKGGNGNYTYAWDNGETTQEASKLAPGIHQVTITDENGCQAVAEIGIKENILPLEANIEVVTAINCFADEAALRVNHKGGKGPFQYEWNNPSISGEEAQSISAGNYSVTVTDSQGKKVSAEVTLEAPAELNSSTAFLQAARDETTQDGKASVEAKGGTPNYTIAWDNGETTATASALTFGKHIVSVTDAKGCVDTSSVFVEKRKIPELAVESVAEGQKIRIEALQFQADSTKIQERYFPVLDELHSFLESNKTVAIEIGGHTNSLPPDWYCDELSTKRAKSISDYLVNLGIAKWRVLFKGYGKRFPIASNDTEEGRAQNQRIEITILSLGNK